MQTERSQELFDRACTYIPGGLNTTPRRLPWPLVLDKAEGAYMWDRDGNRYIDYHGGFGPILLGHRHPDVDAAVRDALSRFDLFGVGITELEIELAAKIVEHVPCAERTLLCNTGSEATYHAVRLSRAVTGKPKIIKFQGSYHGFHDYLLMNVISPAESIGKKAPMSAGMLDAAIEETLIAPFNDLIAVAELFDRHDGQIAGVIIDPIQHGTGCVLPAPKFLEGLRELCSRRGAILTFDEVVTGFRHSLGGYQAVAGVTPDLTTLGKAMANGYPISAICGRADLMDRFQTAGGDVFFSGTFNGHAAGCAASIRTIELLEDGEIYNHIFSLGQRIRDGLTEITKELDAPMTVKGFGSVFVVYFLDGPVSRYEDLLRNDDVLDIAFRRHMVENGEFFMPTALMRQLISASHTEAVIDRTLEVAQEALVDVASRYERIDSRP